MESVVKIRHAVLRNKESIRSVSRRTGLSRNTIRKYLLDPSPPSYQRSASPALHKLSSFESRLRGLYEHDQSRPQHERRTAVKLYEELVGEGYEGSYYPVCRFIRKLKSEPSLNAAFIPLQFKAGDALQSDWSEEHVVLDGVDCKIKLVHFRLSHSRKTFVRAYPNECQEMVLDAFVPLPDRRMFTFAEKRGV